MPLPPMISRAQATVSRSRVVTKALASAACSSREDALLLQLRDPHRHAERCGDVAEHPREQVLDQLEAGRSACRTAPAPWRTRRPPRRRRSGSRPRTRPPRRGSARSTRLVSRKRVAALAAGSPAGTRQSVEARCRRSARSAARLVLDLGGGEAGGVLLDDEALDLVVVDVLGPDDDQVGEGARCRSTAWRRSSTHSSPSRRAVVRRPPATSEPPCGSVRPKRRSSPAAAWPAASGALLLGAEDHQRAHGQAVVDAEEGGDRRVDPGGLQRDEAGEQAGGARRALGVVAAPDQPRLGEARDQVEREGAPPPSARRPAASPRSAGTPGCRRARCARRRPAATRRSRGRRTGCRRTPRVPSVGGGGCPTPQTTAGAIVSRRTGRSHRACSRRGKARSTARGKAR